jgi:hypothetical protein
MLINTQFKHLAIIPVAKKRHVSGCQNDPQNFGEMPRMELEEGEWQLAGEGGTISRWIRVAFSPHPTPSLQAAEADNPSSRMRPRTEESED